MKLKLTAHLIATIVLLISAQSGQAQQAQPNIQVVQPTTNQSTPYLHTETSTEQRLALLESRLTSVESAPAPRSSCRPCATPSMRVSTNSVGCGSVYGGFDFAILKANVGSISGAIPPLAIAGSVTSTVDFDLAPRVFVGLERADGLGFRATYFNYDQDSDASDLGVVTDLEMHALDLEVTSRIKFCGSDLLLSSGFRYADLNQDYIVPGTGALEFDSEGAGLTLGGRFTRDLGTSGWDLILGGRASLLLSDNELSIPGLVTIAAEESTLKIWEAQAGVSRSRQLASGAQLVTELTFETQNWDAAAIAGLIGNEVSLYGPSIRLGLNY